MEEKEYSVSEAVQLIGAPSHVLRYWEEELQLPVKRTGQGHRIYTEQDVMTFRRVRELKENGIQLKAIRVLLHGEEQTILGETQSLAEKILEVERRMESGQASEEETADIADQYEIVLKEKREHLRQFEEILKGLMEQVIEEQNKKLEQTISDIIRREIEDLYLQYYGEIAREAAATRNREPSTRGILTWLRSLFCGKR